MMELNGTTEVILFSVLYIFVVIPLEIWIAIGAKEDRR